MNSIDPCISPELLPEGSRAIVIAKNDPDFDPLPSVRTPKGQVITRWQLTEAERFDIAHGVDLYITILSFGSINPIVATAGVVDWNTQPLPEQPKRLRVPDDLMIACRALLDSSRTNSLEALEARLDALQAIQLAMSNLEAT